MIAEAIDTVITLGWALLAWILVLATVGTIIVVTAAATGVWAVGALRARRSRTDHEEAA